MVDMQQFTKEIIRIPSTSDNIDTCEHVLAYIRATLDAGEIVWYDGVPSLIVTNYDYSATGKQADIILAGHIDVVPPTMDGQFDPYEEDGKLYGRGAGDMKAGVAILVDTMQKVLADSACERRVALCITSDEEVGGARGAGALVADGWIGKLVFVPDSGDRQRFVTAEKGVITAVIDAHGHACHSSRPRLGENAIEHLYEIYTTIKKRIIQPDALVAPDYWSSTCEVTMIQGGSAMNTLPGTAQMTLNIRYTQEWTYEKLTSMIQQIVREHNSKVTFPLSGALLYTSPDDPLITCYHEHARRVLGEGVIQGQEHGASDGRFYAAAGSVVILHRPTCYNIHGDDEYVMIDDMEPLRDLYLAMIADTSW